jgi:uncharacterized membrane protein YebE (DUF533 family)
MKVLTALLAAAVLSPSAMAGVTTPTRGADFQAMQKTQVERAELAQSLAIVKVLEAAAGADDDITKAERNQIERVIEALIDSPEATRGASHTR